MLSPAESTRAARLFLADLDESPHVIGGLVPDRFESYVRVLAPIQTSRGFTTWTKLSRQDSLELHAETPWSSFSPLVRAQAQPLMGSLGGAAASVLCALLERHSSSPECYFAMWLGYGGFTAPRGAEVVMLPPGRECVVFRGLLSDGATNFESPPGRRESVRWVPAGSEWFLAGDIYSTSAVIAGSRDLIRDVHAAPELEAITLSRNSKMQISDL